LTRKCPKCGDELENETETCSNCGKEITEDMDLHDNGSNSIAFYQTSSPKWLAAAMISALVIFGLMMVATGGFESGKDIREVPSGNPAEVVDDYIDSIHPTLFYDMEKAYSLTAKKSWENVSEFKSEIMLDRGEYHDKEYYSRSFEEAETVERSNYSATVEVQPMETTAGVTSEAYQKLKFNLTAKEGKWKIVSPPDIYGEDTSCSGAGCYE
jgi:hypothetical protein